MNLPHKFGKYILVSKIAQGGMAEIYRAKYLGEGGFVKEVAVKRILPHWSDNKEFVTMLCDEARALVHLQHQNIVQVYELGKDGEVFYISMEYVDGIDLRRLFKKVITPDADEIPIKFVCFIVAEILKALNFAHTRTDKQGRLLGIIHRDVSPQNVLLSYNGEVKAVDFGIAKGAHRSFETAVAQVKGKYAYMSPEQASGKTIDARTDLYAVGVILYELITRRRLYDAPNDLLTIEEVKKSVMPDGWEENVAIGIRPIVRRALQRDVDKRYLSAEEFLGDLNRFIVANKLVTHGIELSMYIKELFHEEYEQSLKEEDVPVDEAAFSDDRPQTKILSIISKTRPEGSRLRLFFSRHRLFLVVILMVIMGSAASLFILHRPAPVLAPTPASVETTQVAPTTAQPAPTIPSAPNVPAPVVAAAPAPSSPPVAVIKPSAPAQTEAAKPVSASTGTLSIQARPWGYVYVPGYVNRQETPIRGIKLKPGDYVVKVNYEPEDKWVQQKITVAENSRITCIAEFGEKSLLTCKSLK